MDKEEKLYDQATVDILKNRFGIYQLTEKQIEDMSALLLNN